MTIGGVAAVSEFSSLQLIFVRLFLSVFYLVILADAGIHRTASVVARYYRFVTGIVVGFALCSCWLWQMRFQTRHPVCVDEWIPVCTGMTIGGVAAVSEFSSLQLIFVRLFLSVFYLVILANAGIYHTASVALCAGMTAGGMARYDEISVSATFLEVPIHFYFPNFNLYIEY